MLIEVKVPVLSESVSEATLLTWHKKQGEFVQRDENLIDIETDKVVLELPAPDAGVLASIVKADGSMVTSNEVIATIDTSAKHGAAAPAKAEVLTVQQIVRMNEQGHSFQDIMGAIQESGTVYRLTDTQAQKLRVVHPHPHVVDQSKRQQQRDQARRLSCAHQRAPRDVEATDRLGLVRHDDQ